MRVSVALAITTATFMGLTTFGRSALPAGADPIADCSTTQGEIVVVDFSPWGGNIVRGCAATLSTGYAGLQAAGFTTAGDDHDGPALICRLDDDPPPSQDACVNTPPASAYWSDWHAAAGQNTWSYSTQGPMSYEPQPGSVDAWVFGGTNVAGTNGQPTFTPAQVRATNIDPVGSGDTTTTVPPTTPPTTAASAGPPAAVTPGAGGATTSGNATGSAGTSHPGTTVPSGAGADPTSTSTSTPAGPPTASTNDGRTDPASRTGAGPKIVDASPTLAKQPSAGSPLPFVIGGVVVLALAAAGGIIALRRRRLRSMDGE